MNQYVPGIPFGKIMLSGAQTGQDRMPSPIAEPACFVPCRKIYLTTAIKSDTIMTTEYEKKGALRA